MKVMLETKSREIASRYPSYYERYPLSYGSPCAGLVILTALQEEMGAALGIMPLPLCVDCRKHHWGSCA
jgi:hypothetical protein